MIDLPLTGGCNCGAVRYEVTAPLVAASYCHCKRCQRRSGAAASANAHPAPGTFRIVSGHDQLRVWKPDGGGEKWFCGTCGSSVYAHNPHHADPIGIRMGTFDDDPGIVPSVRQFVAYARTLGANPERRAATPPRESPRTSRTLTTGQEPGFTSSRADDGCERGTCNERKGVG